MMIASTTSQAKRQADQVRQLLGAFENQHHENYRSLQCLERAVWLLDDLKSEQDGSRDVKHLERLFKQHMRREILKLIAMIQQTETLASAYQMFGEELLTQIKIVETFPCYQGRRLLDID